MVLSYSGLVFFPTARPYLYGTVGNLKRTVNYHNDSDFKQKLLPLQVEGSKPKGWNFTNSDYSVSIKIYVRKITYSPVQYFYKTAIRRKTFFNKIHSGIHGNLEQAIVLWWHKNKSNWWDKLNTQILLENGLKEGDIQDVKVGRERMVIKRLRKSRKTKRKKRQRK